MSKSLLFSVLLSVSLSVSAALPPKFASALQKAGISEQGVGLWVSAPNQTEADWSHRPDSAMNPASTMKLLTTLAGLELLGENFHWKTPVYTMGSLEKGILKGDLYIQGQGNPAWTVENIQQFVQTIRLAGLHTITGNVYVDLRYLPESAQHHFDPHSNKPYNVSPDALFFNFKSVAVKLTAQSGFSIKTEPALAGMTIHSEHLTFSPSGRACETAKNTVQIGLKAHSSGLNLHLTGRLPAGCDHTAWIAIPNGYPYQAAMLATQFQEQGIQVQGHLTEAAVPQQARLWLEAPSPPLKEVIQSINKYSNNPQARLLFLALAQKNPTSQTAAIEAVQQWLTRSGLTMPELVLENGSGLSRQERISPRHLAALISRGIRSPLGSVWLASFPVAGQDGTLRKRLKDSSVTGMAHLKTGTLQGVRALAGTLDTPKGQKVLVVFLNHPRADNAMPILDNLVKELMEG